MYANSHKSCVKRRISIKKKSDLALGIKSSNYRANYTVYILYLYFIYTYCRYILLTQKKLT